MRAALPFLFLLAACGGGGAGGDSPPVPATSATAPTASAAPDEVACPPQATGGMFVLLVSGQSNAANFAEHKYESAYGSRVLNFHDGRCFVAESPLLGANGAAGESWTLLGNKLVAAGAAQVIIIPDAVGGTPIARWQAGADLNASLLATIASAAQYRITHVLWHQGEADYLMQTSGSAYTSMFYSMVDSIRAAGVDAPVYASVATYCNPPNEMDNPISQAQRALPNTTRNVRAGVDTDTLVLPEDRFDGCHFAISGQEKFSDAWLAILTH